MKVKRVTPKVTREEIAQAFVAAKQMTATNGAEIRVGKNRFEFICHALNWYGRPGWKEATDIIQQRFNPELTNCGTIYSWLLHQGIDWRLLTDNNVQAYKHRWLDSVIKEFSA